MFYWIIQLLALAFISGFLMVLGIFLMPDHIFLRIDAWIKSKCWMCGMAREMGHWPGCDYWRGENLELLILREKENEAESD